MQGTNQRIHYLDAGRALTCIAVVLYHSSAVFSRHWVVNVDASRFSQTMVVLSSITVYFMMPMFLFIAGYFTMCSLRTYSARAYLRRRSRRVLLPFVVSVITLLPVQQYFKLKHLYGEQWRIYLADYVNPISPEFTFEHLWFIYHILVFALLLVVCKKTKCHLLVPAFARSILHFVHQYLPVTILFWATMAVVLQVGGQVLSIRLDLHRAWLDLDELGKTFPMFLFGCYCFCHHQHMDEIFRPKARRIAVLFGVFAAFFPFRVYLESADVPVPWSVLASFDSVLSWILTIGVLGFLRLRMGRSSHTLTYLSDASYPVYLFHQPIVVAIGFFVVNSSFPISNWTGFALVSILALALSHLVYLFLVRRNRFGSFLYTGVVAHTSGARMVQESQTATPKAA